MTEAPFFAAFPTLLLTSANSSLCGLRAIKGRNHATLTAVYAGQFEFVDPCYDLQRAAMQDPAYSGMFLHDDHGRLVRRGSFFIWDFRNSTAVAFHTEQVAGYFASQQAVDGVFFDEGDSFACQYSCKAYDTCNTMPNATAWHTGALQAWVGAAQLMAQTGKRAILSSQNAFLPNTPELWKEAFPHGCPFTEDTAAAMMNQNRVNPHKAPCFVFAGSWVLWSRFYEYWLVPEQFNGGKTPRTPWLPGDRLSPNTWRFCRNQVANAIQEGKTSGVHFVAAGTSAWPGWGTAERLDALQFSLGGFLIAQSADTGEGWDRDFYGWDHQIPHTQYGQCNHTRWGDCASSWDEVQGLFSLDFGKPMSDAVEIAGPGSGVFFRQYSKLNISLDCGKINNSSVGFHWS
eukprot:gene10838-38_t